MIGDVRNQLMALVAPRGHASLDGYIVTVPAQLIADAILCMDELVAELEKQSRIAALGTNRLTRLRYVEGLVQGLNAAVSAPWPVPLVANALEDPS